jgi:hypothetical protein
VRVRNTCASLLCLLGFCVLGVPEIAAQDEPDQQPAVPAPAAEARSREGAAVDDDALQPTSRRTPQKSNQSGEPETAPPRFFFDDFASASLEQRNWEAAVGATPTRDLLDQGQPVAAIRLAADQNAAGRQPELRSVVIGLAGVPGAELSYTVQHHGVEAGERLVVEYLSEGGQWCPIERVVADGQDSVGFSRHMHRLPEDALHEAFQVRFQPDVNDGDDAWYLGEVSVVGYEPLHKLAVRLRPPRNALVEVVPAGRSERLDGTTPFTRWLRVGARVYLVAPPVVEGWVFSHWSVDGATQADRERILTLEPSKETEAVAHYRPWVPYRSEASVAIVSVPGPGVRIALGPDPERLYTHVVTNTERRCLTGEWLTLLAPARTERLVFVGWVVNGEVLPSGDTLLEHRVTGDDVLLADYALLGDMNGDGELDKFDVDAFVGALIDPLGYAEQYPDLDPVARGDMNGDGVFDPLDVEGFVDLLMND